MARTTDGFFENPGPVDEVVRDLEDSGYPVDGSTEELIRRPGGLSVATEVPEKSGQRSRGGHIGHEYHHRLHLSVRYSV